MLSLSKGGPILKTALDLVVTWQLDHPRGTKEEAGAWLQGQYEAGRVGGGVGEEKGAGKEKEKTKKKVKV